MTARSCWTDFHPNFDAFLERGQAFWRNTSNGPALLALRFSDAPLPYGEGDLDDDLRMLDAYYSSQFRRMAGLDLDGVMGAHSFRIFRHALMPSIVSMASAPYSSEGWTRPVLDDLERADELNWNLSGPTFNDLEKFCDYFYPSPSAKSWVPLTSGLVWGPTDLALTLRGAVRFCMDYYENREAFLRLLDLATEFCIRFGKYMANRAALPELQGGLLSAEPGVYHPPDSVNCADDNIILFGGEAQCPEIWDAERKFLGAFKGGALMELHSASTQHYASYFGKGGPSVVEVSQDPCHRSVDGLCDLLEPYRGRKPLRFGPAWQNIPRLHARWSGTALMFDAVVPSENEARQLLNALRTGAAGQTCGS